ncbi:thioredoxin family protein [Chryseotalea sanaruensis]|uniref:Thioredoxin family protein n=1 Tax=Chryseotalea sanaruensis TaxID=2482724 RepID=A0A401UCV8_9BACT|nr:thioredoxin family protein [Chryseotalea sanaruensis]GCC52713.1 thioredoxin family protein [Chryseotalea sanaruensis]
MATSIKILGPGCAKCKTTFEVVKKAVEQSGVQAEITKIEDLEGMMKYNILTTPVVVVNEQIKISGRVPSVDEILKLLN